MHKLSDETRMLSVMSSLCTETISFLAFDLETTLETSGNGPPAPGISRQNERAEIEKWAATSFETCTNLNSFLPPSEMSRCPLVGQLDGIHRAASLVRM